MVTGREHEIEKQGDTKMETETEMLREAQRHKEAERHRAREREMATDTWMERVRDTERRSRKRQRSRNRGEDRRDRQRQRQRLPEQERLREEGSQAREPEREEERCRDPCQATGVAGSGGGGPAAAFAPSGHVPGVWACAAVCTLSPLSRRISPRVGTTRVPWSGRTTRTRGVFVAGRVCVGCVGALPGMSVRECLVSPWPAGPRSCMTDDTRGRRVVSVRSLSSGTRGAAGWVSEVNVCEVFCVTRPVSPQGLDLFPDVRDTVRAAACSDRPRCGSPWESRCITLHCICCSVCHCVLCLCMCIVRATASYHSEM